MQIDLGGLADGAEPVNEHWFGYHWTAALQPVIILLGSIPRFFLNDLRPRHNPNGETCESIPQPFCNLLFGSLCYVLGIALWVITTLNLLLHVGFPDHKTTAAAREDAYLIWGVALVQGGYPIVSTLQILWLNFCSTTLNPKFKGTPMPGNQMDQLLSTIKDVGYGVLDASAKGGLALFCALRATRS